LWYALVPLSSNQFNFVFVNKNNISLRLVHQHIERLLGDFVATYFHFWNLLLHLKILRPEYTFAHIGEGIQAHHITWITNLYDRVPKPRLNILNALLFLQRTLEEII
jgi:hypothetical protein